MMGKKRVPLQNTEPIPDDMPTNLSIREASKLTGISEATIYGRLNAGWSKEEAFYRKVRYNKNNKKPFDDRVHEKVGEIKDRSVEEEYLVKQKNG